MIKVLKITSISKDLMFSTENEARIHVLPNEAWVAFEIPKDTITDYVMLTLEVSYKDTQQQVRAYGVTVVDTIYIIAAMGLSYNDLYATYKDGVTENHVVVPTSSAIGFVENMHRKKYITTTVNAFWNANMVPVIITK